MSDFNTIRLARPPLTPAEYRARRADDRPAATITVTATSGSPRPDATGRVCDVTCASIARLICAKLPGWEL